MAKNKKKEVTNQRHYHSGVTCRAGAVVLQSSE